jgi:hypothetical protein
MKLTEGIKNQIIKDCLVASFSKQNADIEAREHDLAMELYRAVFDKETIEAASKMPEHWLRMDGCLIFNCGGYRLTLHTKKEVPVPYSKHCSPLGAVTGVLAERAQAHANEKEALREKRREACNALAAMLSSINTLKQLAQTWPEGEPFYRDYLRKNAPQLPAVQVAKINELLNIQPITTTEAV